MPPARLSQTDTDGDRPYRYCDGMALLDADAVRAALIGLDGWDGGPDGISRTVRLPSFPAAINTSQGRAKDRISAGATRAA